VTDLVEMGKRRVESLPDGRTAAIHAARAAAEKKAFDVRILEVGSMIFITDYFVIASGATERQVKTIVEEVDRAMNAIGLRALRREGEREARWVLLDFGDVVVHVFTNEDRQYYELERLWKGAADIDWNESSGAASSGGSKAASSSASAGRWTATRRRTRG
jgi:ribosome-associated protein